VAVPEIRRRFGLDPDAMSRMARNGTSAYIGLPERESLKLQELWVSDQIGIELSVEVHAPVVVGVYPMRIARYVLDHGTQASSWNGDRDDVATTPPAGLTTSSLAPNARA
jgi:hypothetical protein